MNISGNSSELKKLLWKNNLELFSRDVLKFGEEPTLATPPFMKEWYSTLQDSRNKRIIELAPRSHAKSQTHTVNYLTWEIYRNPNIRAVIASNTASMASAFSREIRERIETEPNLTHLMPTDRQAKWTDAEFKVQRTLVDRNQTITTTGANSSILSKRCDIIVCDDIIDEENSRTPNQRERVKTWFYKTLLPILEPHGKLILVGTRWHGADLYGEILGLKEYPIGKYFETGDFIARVDKAILDEANKQTLWEERWNYNQLEAIRKKSIAIFNCQYQNDPSALQGKRFKWDWFNWYEFDGTKIRLKTEESIIDIELSELDVYIGIDPAISKTEQADYFALVVIGIDKTGRIFVLDYVNEHRTFNQQIEAIFAMVQKWNPIRVGVETNSYQEALKQEIDRLSIDRGIYLTIKEIRSRTDKMTRSVKLSSIMERGFLYFRKEQGEMIDTLLQFVGEHDDLFDGLDFAVNAAEEDSELQANILWT